MCSHGKVDFRSLNDLEYKDIRNSVNILIFASIAPQTKVAVCANNRSWAPPSTNIFDLVIQNFHPGNDNIAVKLGSLLSGGWKIGDISFPKPWVTGGTIVSPDDEILKGFDNCFFSTFPENIRERIFRSLDWFRMAHLEIDQVSELSKVVMITTGFEILLQFPKWNKRKHFVNYLEKHIASDKFNKDTRTINNGKRETLSLAGCWANDFYELRNLIVHGDYIPLGQLTYKDWITHLIVADLVFLECIKRELFINYCIGNNFHKEIDKLFLCEPKTTSRKLLIRSFLGFNDVYRALGWVGENRAGNSI